MALIPAFQQNDTLIAQADAHLKDPTGFRIWWLGQSGFLIQYNGERILLDPYLSDSLTRKYEGTDKPHIRMSERVIEPSMLKNISIVSSSHNHTDHLDAATLIPILENNKSIRLIIPEANRNFVATRLGCDESYPDGLNDGHMLTIGQFTFHGIPASHNEIDRDQQGNCLYMGYVVCFGEYKVYHSGDTLWFNGLEELLLPFEVDLAILPINGNDPSRRVAGNLDGIEAARLGRSINAELVIPCHYDMFAFNTADPETFAMECRSIGQPYRVLKLGEGMAIG
jgi:L-ascorbate metabolism protein UlaG (beta-lactamase superfamily)